MVRQIVFSVVLFSLTAATFAQQNSTRHQEGLKQNEPDSFVLKGAKIVVQPGKAIPDATLVIRDGRVVSLRGADDWPADHRVIDMSGKTIYPGFIDAYSEQEIMISEAPEHTRYWNSNIRPSRDVAGAFEWSEGAAREFRKNGFTAVLAAPGQGIFRGQSALLLADDSNQELGILVSRVAQHAELTVQRRFGGPRVYPSSPMGAVALARQALLDAQWYDQAWKVVTTNSDINLPETNASLHALRPLLSGDQPLMVSTSNELMVLRADRFAREFDLNLMIVGNGNEYRRLDAISKLGRPYILPVNFPAPPAVGTAEDALNVTLESLMHWDLAPENPAMLSQAGVEFAFTSHRLEKKSDFLKRVRQAVQRGLDKDVALAAMTINPARFYKIENHIGTIESGKLANLVITDGDLFDEKTKIVETWVAGSRFEMESGPVRQVDGQWEIDLAGTKISLTIEGTGGRLSGNLSLPGNQASDDDQKSKPQEEKQEGEEENTSKSGKETAKTKSLALVESRLSGSFKSDCLDQPGTAQFSMIVDSDNETAEGYIVWPTGQRQPMTGRKTEASEHSDDEESNKKKGERTEDSAEGSSSGKKSRADDAAFSKQPSSFPVNYPLGAFGITDLPEQETVLFDNVTVWTCAKAGKIQGGAVLVKGGKIAGVFDANTDRPTADTIVDGTGMHLTPGIIDCHSHFASDSGINEGSQAVTAEVRIGDFVDCDDITIYRQLAGGVTGSNILHGSANPIGGQNQVVKLRWGMLDEEMKMQEAPAGIKFALGENVKRSNGGRRRPGDPPRRYPTTRMGVEQLMHDTFRSALQYKAAHDAWNSDRKGLPPKRDLEMEAIVEILEGKRWIHCHSYRQDEILALIRVLDEYEITIGTFQHILEGYKVAEKMKEHGAMASGFSDWWAYKFEVYDAIPYAGKLMHDVGIVVSFNSDDGELATHLNQEAAKAVKYGGVPEMEALKFVTLNPAKQLRIDQYTGSIETGKQADLALWNAPPLSAYARCQQTWVDGRKHFDVKLDQENRRIAADMRQTLIQKILNSGEKMRPDDSRNDDPQNLWPRYDEYCGSHINKNDDYDMLQQLQEAWLAEEDNQD